MKYKPKRTGKVSSIYLYGTTLERLKALEPLEYGMLTKMVNAGLEEQITLRENQKRQKAGKQ
jgi:hypothetical protein